MARAINKLTPLAVSKKTQPGYYGDGGGLWLQVSKSGSKSWIFRFTLNGRSREMGLGAIHTISLAEAREEAHRCRQFLRQGVDPLQIKREKAVAKRLEAAKAMSFDECSAAYLKAHRYSWKNAKHAAQWKSTLSTYASPVFGRLPVAEVDTALVMKCLEPIWQEKTETASRLRGRIESVLDWATVRGYRHGDNPARWRGHLNKLLPARSKVQKVKHHAALPYKKIGLFIQTLRQQEGIAARAFEFAILTAARTGEVTGATWDEIDLAAKVWTLPASRMKVGREHRVPLSNRAIAILEEMEKFNGAYIFPGQSKGKLSNMAFLMLLRRMEHKGLTAHGFRSTFRDWAAEMTAYPREVAEMALAHALNNTVEAAYRRGDLFEKRVRLMADWALYCEQEPLNVDVTPIRQQA
ncbi:tyrosine-type recombinase/integrase [Nitrosococcus wardiae]|uniref:Site-specific integrase n=1 Tax=Nitrosococcus wardiae TaxID=1814290 RepID=A0A4P7BYK9_9GAMM|nr:site-specific integrase [Nitrosococcus wardiae]QBQ54329.1 site-specific integrase [Nitrosococcus wardiae]